MSGEVLSSFFVSRYAPVELLTLSACETAVGEVIAMNHLLSYSGVHSAREFDRKLREYLEQDHE